MNGNYLIPSNTKKGQLILSIFTPIDLVIFLTGMGTTLLLVSILPMEITWVAVLAIAPAIFCALLVAPVAYYHNVRQLIIEIYKYFTNRNKFVWKGWCYKNESDSK